MATLFEIGADLQALDDLIEELGGDVSDPQVDAAITAWQQSLADDEGAKLDGYVNLIKRLDGEADIAESEAEEYRKRAETRRTRVKWLKARMLAYLQAGNRTKAQTATGRTVAVQLNGGKAPLVVNWDLIDLKKLAPPFVRIKRELDQDAVREAIERGEPFEHAELRERGHHLRIR